LLPALMQCRQRYSTLRCLSNDLVKPLRPEAFAPMLRLAVPVPGR
jgi:hypothetical protein